jgi:predicted MFS family arabinose efflux permease
MVAAIQLSIMLGGAFGGYLLDAFSAGATFTGGSLLLFAAAVAGGGKRIRPLDFDSAR